MEAGRILVAFKVDGNKEVSDVYEQTYFDVNGKIERTFTGLISTDGWLSVPFSKLGGITHIQVVTSNSIVRITTSTPETISIPVSGRLYWQVPEVLSDIITAIDISTTSTTAVDAEVSLWSTTAVD